MIEDGNSLVIKDEVNGTPCKLTLDTGASRTVISFRIASRCFVDHTYNQVGTNLVTTTGQHISVRGEKKVELKLGSEVYQHNAIVADIVDDCIVGLDFMKTHSCEIDVRQGVLKCSPEEISMEGASFGKVYCLKRSILTPRSETVVPVSLPQKSNSKPRCVLTERLDEEM